MQGGGREDVPACLPNRRLHSPHLWRHPLRPTVHIRLGRGELVSWPTQSVQPVVSCMDLHQALQSSSHLAAFSQHSVHLVKHSRLVRRQVDLGRQEGRETTDCIQGAVVGGSGCSAARPPQQGAGRPHTGRTTQLEMARSTLESSMPAALRSSICPSTKRRLGVA